MVHPSIWVAEFGAKLPLIIEDKLRINLFLLLFILSSLLVLLPNYDKAITNYDSYYELRQLLHVTTEQSFITFSPLGRSFLKNILKN